MPPSPPRAHTRINALDHARGFAIVLMVIAHTNPSDGPARIFLTSEFLTAPLFAFLVGAGVQLAAGRTPSWIRFARTQILRALTLGILSVILTNVYGGVVVVLAALGVLIVACTLVVKMPTWTIAALIPLAIALTPLLAHAASTSRSFGASPDMGTRLLLWSSAGPYHLPAFIAYGFSGMVLARYLRAHRDSLRAVPFLTWGIILLGAMLCFLVIPNLLGYEVHAYEGSFLETVGNLAGVSGIVLVFLAGEAAQVVHTSPLSRPYGLITAPLRSMGRASLFLYVLHIVLLRLWVTFTHRSDDAWIVTIGSLLIMATAAWGWRALFAHLSRGEPSPSQRS